MQYKQIVHDLCKKCFISNSDIDEICRFVDCSYLKKPFGKVLVFCGSGSNGKTTLKNSLFKLNGLNCITFTNIHEMIYILKNEHYDKDLYTIALEGIRIPIEFIGKNLEPIIGCFNIVIVTNNIQDIDAINVETCIVNFPHKF